MKPHLYMLLVATLALGSVAGAIHAANVDLESGTIFGSCVYVDAKYGSAQSDISPADFAQLDLEPGDLLAITFDGISLQVPYVYIPGDVPPGSLLAFQYGGGLFVGLQYGNFVVEYGIEAGMSVEVTLLEKGGYAAELAVQHLERPTDRASYESDEAYANFRMISCGTIAENRLYRSCHPASGDSRSPYAAALMTDAAIRTVVNVGESPDGLESAYSYNSLYRALGLGGKVLALDLGLVVEGQIFREGAKRAVEFIAMGEAPFLIHCWEGKDRTGVLAAILEALLGASLEEIVADYMTTYSNYYGITANHALYEDTAGLIVSKLEEMGQGETVTSENVNAVVERYVLEELGVSEDVLALLRAVLEP